MSYQAEETRYDKLLAFTDCVADFASNPTIPSSHIADGNPFQLSHSAYYDNFAYAYDNNRYIKEEPNQKTTPDCYPTYINQQPNNLMLLSQIINEPDMLIGTGINGRLTLNEEVEFLVKNPQYLSSSISNLKVNKNITQQLFARNEFNRYPCKFCSQNFKRINGLKRHIMMHLNIKPYQCHLCFRCFSRIDVFKRHLLRTKCVANS